MDLQGHFRRITKTLRKNGLDYRVVGGIALAFYMEPRATVDIDLLVKPEDLQGIVGALDKLGYRQYSAPMRMARGKIFITRLLYVRNREHFMVDLLWSTSNPVTGLWDRARYYELEGRPVPVLDPDGLIILKKLRNSDQDKVDIKSLKAAKRRARKKPRNR